MLEQRHADARVPAAIPPDPGPYLLRVMDWDDLPRLAAMGKDGPDPFTYCDLAQVMERQYLHGIVCATPTGPTGYLVYVASDGTSKEARMRGKPYLAAGLVRVVVAREWRRQGVGRFLVDKVTESLLLQFRERASTGRLRLHATVHENWLHGQLFLKSLDFRTPANKSQAIQRRPFGSGCEADGYLLERFVGWPARRTAG